MKIWQQNMMKDYEKYDEEKIVTVNILYINNLKYVIQRDRYVGHCDRQSAMLLLLGNFPRPY